MNFKRKIGFTLLETLVFAGVFVVVMTAIAVSLNYVYRSGRFVFEQTDATNEVRKGVQVVVQAIRESAYADNGAYPLASMSESDIVVYSDTDNDGDAEKIRFMLENETLKKSVVSPSGNPPVYTESPVVSTIAHFVRNDALLVPLFTYYDEEGVVVTDHADVKRVASVLVRLVVNLYPERAPEDYEIRSRATFRNAQ